MVNIIFGYSSCLKIYKVAEIEIKVEFSHLCFFCCGDVAERREREFGAPFDRIR